MARLLYISDSHIPLKTKRTKIDLESSPIHVFNWIKNTVKEKNINILVFGGDLFDRGSEYENTSFINRIETLLEEISNEVEYIFMVMGNHELNYCENNPTFRYLDITDIDVLSQYKYKNILKPTRKLIKVVKMVSIGNTDLYFHHFTNEKRYSVSKELAKDRFVVGFYHDDIVTFESKEVLYHHRIGRGIKAVNNNLFENVNIAILGHIHTPLETISLNNSRETVIITPGSMIRNNSKEDHEKVVLPILDITEESFSMEMIEYNLPNYEKDFDQTKVDETREKYEVNKILNEERLLAKSKIHEEDILETLKDIELIKLYNMSKDVIITDSYKSWNNYNNEKFKNIGD